MGSLYAVVLSVVNLFGCFGLPRWAVEAVLPDEFADVTIPTDYGEVRRYPVAGVCVSFDKKGRAVGVAAFRSP